MQYRFATSADTATLAAMSGRARNSCRSRRRRSQNDTCCSTIRMAGSGMGVRRHDRVTPVLSLRRSHCPTLPPHRVRPVSRSQFSAKIGQRLLFHDIGAGDNHLLDRWIPLPAFPDTEPAVCTGTWPLTTAAPALD
jgi:hypothetical protein